MPDYIPSPRQWVRDQVELYEKSGGTEGTTLRDTGLPVIIVTHTGGKTGAIRKTPLMRVKDGDHYVLVGSMGGASTNPVWVYNLRANPSVEIRDLAVVQRMGVREVEDEGERARLWALAVAAFPPYAEYQAKTTRIFRSSSQSRGGRKRDHNSRAFALAELELRVRPRQGEPPPTRSAGLPKAREGALVTCLAVPDSKNPSGHACSNVRPRR